MNKKTNKKTLFLTTIIFLILISTNTFAAATLTMDSAKTKTTTAIDVTFNNTLDAASISTGDFEVAGNTITNATATGNTVTLTLGTPIATDATPAVSLIGEVSDSFGIGDNTLSTAGPITPTDGIQPVLTSVSISSNNANASLAKAGDTITVTFTGSEALQALPTGTIDGQTATVALTSGNSYTSKFIMTSAEAEGTIAFIINFSDTAGNAGTQVTAVTDTSSVAFDKTAPVLTGTPANIIINATSSAGAVATYTNPTATDNAGGIGTVICSPASGSTFPLGNTTVTCNVADAAGNPATQTTFTVTVQDTIAPAISSFTSALGSNWTNQTTPTFNISASDSGSGLNTMQFSCTGNGSDWTGDAGYTSGNYSGFNITTNTNCSSSNGPKNIWVRVKDNAGNWSSAYAIQASINFDNTVPAVPATPTVLIGNAQVTVTWSTVSDNASNGYSSGIQYYRIYKNGGVYTTVSNSTSSYNITDLSNGTQYWFQISSIDSAGNESGLSTLAYATPQYSSDNTYIPPNQNDTVNPGISWSKPNANASVSGVVELEVNASDNDTGVGSVIFELPDKNYVTVTMPASGGGFNGAWQLKWFTWDLENGKEYTIKAMAKDKGNPRNNGSAWVSRAFKIDNSAALAERQKEDSSAAIADAEYQKTVLEELLQGLELQGIVLGDSIVSDKATAEGFLVNARSSYQKKNYSEAKEKAVLAAEKFSGIKESLSVNPYGSSQEYLFAVEKANIILSGLGFDEAAVNECVSLMSTCNVKREFRIQEVNENGAKKYLATVAIILENSSSEDRELKIIEIVPKEFAQSADLLVSGEPMAVIEADPKIEFTAALKAGETKTISYSLKQGLTKEEADKMLESKPMDLFVAPPIILNKSTEVALLNSGNENAGAAGFFSFAGLGENAGLLGIIIVIVAIIAVALVVYNNKSQYSYGSYNNLGYNGGGTMGFLDKWKKTSSEKKDEQKKGKWGYNGP
ncbi:MAG: HYR domain-containing protein [Candidatus ainarchaeum sp.]|nr:HYR domain-containing protein [Candidatus ainarchaeum sp.]